MPAAVVSRSVSPSSGVPGAGLICTLGAPSTHVLLVCWHREAAAGPVKQKTGSFTSLQGRRGRDPFPFSVVTGARVLAPPRLIDLSVRAIKVA